MGASQALVAIAGLFHLSFGQDTAEMRCYSLQNPCYKDLYVAFGFPVEEFEWHGTQQTRAWWRIDAGHQKKYCFNRKSKLYAYFDWAGSETGHYHSDVALSVGEPFRYCVSQKATHIEREWSRKHSYHTDLLTGRGEYKCEDLGIGATVRLFGMMDDGDFHSAATIRQCPNNAPLAPIEVIHEPFNPNSTDLQHVLNATNPFAVLGYHPQKGWSVEEPKDGQESTENTLLP